MRLPLKLVANILSGHTKTRLGAGGRKEPVADSKRIVLVGRVLTEAKNWSGLRRLLSAVYCLHDHHAQTFNCARNFGHGLHCHQGAGTTSTQCFRHRGRTEALSAERELQGMSWLGRRWPQQGQ